MEHGPISLRLLAEVRESHETLIEYTGAGEVARLGLHALYEALSAGLADMSEEQLLATPSPDEWSMAEVLDHVAEHDRKYEEFHRLGLEHYIEHGLEHALQLWRLRTQAAAAGGRDETVPDTRPEEE
jgi:hypothetical protein